jgi:hypothetical protein
MTRIAGAGRACSDATCPLTAPGITPRELAFRGNLPPSFTRFEGGKLWHLALLEWWLQVHADGVAGEAPEPVRAPPAAAAPGRHGQVSRHRRLQPLGQRGGRKLTDSRAHQPSLRVEEQRCR